jgi:prevent-host-death family protein
MFNSYSIAEARNHLARLVHDVERGLPVELTRRGKRVAVLLSVGQYDQAVGGKRSFWDALTAYRKTADLDCLDVDEVYKDARDKSPGRNVVW